MVEEGYHSAEDWHRPLFAFLGRSASDFPAMDVKTLVALGGCVLRVVRVVFRCLVVLILLVLAVRFPGGYGFIGAMLVLNTCTF